MDSTNNSIVTTDDIVCEQPVEIIDKNEVAPDELHELSTQDVSHKPTRISAISEPQTIEECPEPSPLQRSRPEDFLTEGPIDLDTELSDHSDQCPDANKLLSDLSDMDVTSTDFQPSPTRKRRRFFNRSISECESGEEGNRMYRFLSVPRRAAEEAEDFVRRIWAAGWRVVHHRSLPDWLRDNEYLVRGHRPQLNSFQACIKSMFRIHTETGNIWTHLIGFVVFIGITCYFLSRSSLEVPWTDKAIFSAFFAGAILCLCFSFTFHTMCCHSQNVSRLFNKLDYCGISVMIIGSFIPWLYYTFYCQLPAKIIYVTLIVVLGITSIVVSMWDRFATPKFRPLRAALFIGMGLSGIIPAVHYVVTDGLYNAVYKCSMGWLVLMAILYITGAIIYAVRIPERIFPGKFDIWGQSHQIFHIFVVAAAFVHYHGITEVAHYRLNEGDCSQPLLTITL